MRGESGTEEGEEGERKRCRRTWRGKSGEREGKLEEGKEEQEEK